MVDAHFGRNVFSVDDIPRMRWALYQVGAESSDRPCQAYQARYDAGLNMPCSRKNRKILKEPGVDERWL
jgi:hypothetical protein